MDTIRLLLDALYIASVPFTIYGIRRAQGSQMRDWRALTKDLGLRDVEAKASFWSAPCARLAGRLGPRYVILETIQRAKNDYVTLLSVGGNSGVSLESEESAGARGKALARGELEIGDPEFDAKVAIHGSPERVRALLDVETRRIVLRMLGGHVEVPGGPRCTFPGTVSLVDGGLHALFPLSQRPTSEDLGRLLRALLALAERFDRPRDPAVRLASSIEREPLWRVRLESLKLLATAFPDSEATATTLRHALADEHDEVRLFASATLDKT